MTKHVFFATLILIAYIQGLSAQKSVKAVFTDIPPHIDGIVNDSAWAGATVISDLYQREPATGQPVSERTEFYFLIDRNNLYVGIKCFDEPGGITAKELARDVSLGDDDRVQVILDTYLDGRSGYWFQIGPRGSIGDAIINENGKDFNKSWDGLWDGRASITPEGWEGELIIPFKTMGFKSGSDTWGLKLIRHIKRKSESSYWPATTLDADKFAVSDAGRITGINGITQGIGLDIIPYLTGGISKKKDADARGVFDGGFDAFYQITPSLKAAVTVNTDFAQTEVDEKQINLTRFNLFFPEKRDFFLDGASFFTFGINGDRENPQATQMIPYFSRRIGLDGDGNPVPIKYGGKFTGRIGDWNIGALHIKDDNNFDNPGYTVGRLSRNIGRQSLIGLIGSSGNAINEDANSLAGIDLRLATSRAFGSKNLIFSLYGVKTFTKGLEGNDFSFGTEINYPNDFFNFRAGYLEIGKDFMPGLGFVPRKDIRNIYGSAGFGPRPKNSPVMQVKTGVRYSLISGLSNPGLETAQVDLNAAEITFLSGDIISASSQYLFESLKQDWNIYTGYVIPSGDYSFWRHSLLLTSAKRRNLWASAKVTAGGFYSGNRTDLLIQTGYKIAVPVFLGLESDRRWISLPGGSFTTQIYRLNLNFLFSPYLTWYNYAQYESQNETIGWQSRLQWIIRPGKEIFLTYNSPLIDPNDHFNPEIYEARIKVKYTIRF